MARQAVLRVEQPAVPLVEQQAVLQRAEARPAALGLQAPPQLVERQEALVAQQVEQLGRREQPRPVALLRPAQRLAARRVLPRLVQLQAAQRALPQRERLQVARQVQQAVLPQPAVRAPAVLRGPTKITAFNATPSKVTFGGDINFTWSLSGDKPSDVEIFQEGNSTPILVGLVGETSSTFEPKATANYYLEVTTSSNAVLRSTPVKKVAVAPDVNLEADPDSVATGDDTTLSWTIGGPFTKATLMGGGLNQNVTTATGSAVAKVNADTTYTLTVENGAGVSNSDTVNVTSGPDITSFTITPSTQDAGKGVTFRWTIANFESGKITLSGPNNFSKPFSAGDKSFTLGNVQAANAGPYTLKVESSRGDDVSDPVTLTVN